MIEPAPFSTEELKRRLIWARDRQDPPMKQIAKFLNMPDVRLKEFIADKKPLARHWYRILTDFFHKWDLGMLEIEKIVGVKRIVPSQNPVPRKQMTVDISTGKLSFKTVPQLMGTTAWLPNALNRLEMLGSSENISASPTGRSRRTKKNAL